jgi:hypothetical protein
MNKIMTGQWLCKQCHDCVFQLVTSASWTLKMWYVSYFNSGNLNISLHVRELLEGERYFPSVNEHSKYRINYP